MDILGAPNAHHSPKYQVKNNRTAAMHRLSKINPQMMQQVFSAESEALYNQKDLVGCLPRQASIDSSRSLGKPYLLPPQLTIFYKGTVKVYDISAQKAQAIMTLAGNIIGSPTVDPITEAFSSPGSSLSTSALRHMACIDLPIARQKSLQRFLEKRKDRLNRADPYRRAFMAKQLAKDEFSAKDGFSA